MKPKYLIVDLFGVLFLLNKRSMLYQLGFWNIAKFYTWHRINPLDYYFTLLDRMRLEYEDEFQDIVAYKGFYLPESLCLWQKGLLSNEAALKQVFDYFDSLPQEVCYDRDIMKKVTAVLFSSDALMRSIELNDALYNELISLKNEHSLFLFSNIDLKSFAGIKEMYPHVIALFDDLITSGETHLLKPDVSIFNMLFSKNQLDPTECLLIDDQIENCQTAQDLKMQFLHYTQGSCIKSYLEKNYTC